MIPSIPSPADEAVEEFLASLDAVRARRARGEARVPARAFDPARLANAFHAKRRANFSAVPTRRAQSPAPCPHCAARGDVGCKHFLPFARTFEA